MPDNSGVFATGNNVNVNTGSGSAKQRVQTSGSHQTASSLQQIDQLLAALVASASQLPADQTKVIEDEASWLRSEMHSGEFHRNHIRHALTSLAAAAGQVTPVIELVNQLQKLITGLLH